MDSGRHETIDDNITKIAETHHADAAPGLSFFTTTYLVENPKQ
jgi:hypothetical protein